MERLTFVDEDGRVLFDNPAGFPEDIGFTIRELAENEEWETLDNIAQRLANCEQRLKYYKDLEEQGKLLKLPCAVGDILYYPYINEDEERKIEELEVADVSAKLYQKQDGVWGSLEEIGEEVFLTRPEAERALEEMEEKK